MAGQVTKQENVARLNQGHIARPMHDFQEQCQAVLFVMVCLSLLFVVITGIIKFSASVAIHGLRLG